MGKREWCGCFYFSNNKLILANRRVAMPASKIKSLGVRASASIKLMEGKQCFLQQ
tara:strand:- start:419 stop:583 length:165 start_codon:yes stop_codon:yes gene_type:complete